MGAYQTMVERCSTIGGHGTSSGQPNGREIIIASIVRKQLEDMDPKYPKVDWDPEASRSLSGPVRPSSARVLSGRVGSKATH